MKGTIKLPPPSPAINNQFLKRYQIGTEDPQDKPIATSYLSTPIWSNLIFLETNDIQELRIDTVLMVVDMTKNIVKTPIQGRNGTVKEYISDGDYMINIKGMIVSPYPLQYPRRSVDNLVKFMQVNTQIPVSSYFLEIFGITDIVVDTYQVSEKMGSRNEVPFEINASSDKPLEFQLNPNRGL